LRRSPAWTVAAVSVPSGRRATTGPSPLGKIQRRHRVSFAPSIEAAMLQIKNPAQKSAARAEQQPLHDWVSSRSKCEQRLGERDPHSLGVHGVIRAATPGRVQPAWSTGPSRLNGECHRPPPGLFMRGAIVRQPAAGRQAARLSGRTLRRGRMKSVPQARRRLDHPSSTQVIKATCLRLPPLLRRTPFAEADHEPLAPGAPRGHARSSRSPLGRRQQIDLETRS